jgi:CBS domain-containing protein
MCRKARKMYTLGLDANSLMHKAKTLSPEDTLDDARSAMLKYNISRIVVSRDRKVLGMLTEKDIARFLYREVPSKRFGEVAVNEVMTKKPVTIDEDAGLKTCSRLMLEKEISSLIVVDGRKNIKGVFTKTDLVDAFVLHFAGKHTVKEFMTEKVLTVAPDEPIHMALLLMSGHNLSRVVVAKGGRPIGIITNKDLLPVGAIFGTGTISSYWTTRADIVAKRKQQWYIPSGIKAAFIASDVMTPNPVVATADSDLADAAYVMLRNRISGLPVVDKEGTLAGIITKTDIVRALAEQG